MLAALVQKLLLLLFGSLFWLIVMTIPAFVAAKFLAEAMQFVMLLKDGTPPWLALCAVIIVTIQAWVILHLCVADEPRHMHWVWSTALELVLTPIVVLSSFSVLGGIFWALRIVMSVLSVISGATVVFHDLNDDLVFVGLVAVQAL